VSSKICWQIATRGWFDATKSLERGRGRAQRDAPSPERVGRNSQSGLFSNGNGRGLPQFQLRNDPVRSKRRDIEFLKQLEEKG